MSRARELNDKPNDKPNAKESNQQFELQRFINDLSWSMCTAGLSEGACNIVVKALYVVMDRCPVNQAAAKLFGSEKLAVWCRQIYVPISPNPNLAKSKCVQTKSQSKSDWPANRARPL